jgi:hypothetical protein
MTISDEIMTYGAEYKLTRLNGVLPRRSRDPAAKLLVRAQRGGKSHPAHSNSSNLTAASLIGKEEMPCVDNGAVVATSLAKPLP